MSVEEKQDQLKDHAGRLREILGRLGWTGRSFLVEYDPEGPEVPGEIRVGDRALLWIGFDGQWWVSDLEVVPATRWEPAESHIVAEEGFDDLRGVTDELLHRLLAGRLNEIREDIWIDETLQEKADDCND